MSDQRARGRVKRAFLTSIRKILKSIFNDRADWYDNNRARIVIEEPAISRVRNASRADRTALSRELSPIDDLCACYVTASRRHLQRLEQERNETASDVIILMTGDSYRHGLRDARFSGDARSSFVARLLQESRLIESKISNAKRGFSSF